MLVQEGISYHFNPDQLDGYQMFNVRSNQGVRHINLNTDHPIYDLLRHIEGRLDESSDESDPAFQATVALRLLLASWARMEDGTESRAGAKAHSGHRDELGASSRQVHKSTARQRRLGMSSRPGSVLRRLCSGVQRLVIAAPYIKADALMRVLADS